MARPQSPVLKIFLTVLTGAAITGCSTLKMPSLAMPSVNAARIPINRPAVEAPAQQYDQAPQAIAYKSRAAFLVIPEDKSVSDVLTRWSKVQGAQLDWDSALDYKISARIRNIVSGDINVAIAEMSDALSSAKEPLAIAFSKGVLSVRLGKPGQAQVQPVSFAFTPPVQDEIRDWEILESDGTLQRALSRWAVTAGWEIIWQGLPDIKAPTYAKLPRRTFLDATDYTLGQAKQATTAAGFGFSVTAYPNRVIVIAKETKK